MIAHGRVRLVGPAFHVTVIFFELIHNRSVLTVFVASCCLNFTTDLFEPDGKFRVEVIAFSEGSRKDDGQWLLKIRLGSTPVIENCEPNFPKGS